MAKLKEPGSGGGEVSLTPPVAVIVPPANGIYRVGRVVRSMRASHLDPAQANEPRTGNRYDNEHCGVIYLGTTPECCYAETLARFRPKADLASLVAEDWQPFMAPGNIPADWRARREVVDVRVTQTEAFLDVEAVETREYLRGELALGLSALGVDDLDVSAIRSGDRRIGRLISSWAYQQVDENSIARYAGIRYLSRLNSEWECWAAFDDLLIDSAKAGPIEANDPALSAVCTLFNLTVH